MYLKLVPHSFCFLELNSICFSHSLLLVYSLDADVSYQRFGGRLGVFGFWVLVILANLSPDILFTWSLISFFFLLLISQCLGFYIVLLSLLHHDLLSCRVLPIIARNVLISAIIRRCFVAEVCARGFFTYVINDFCTYYVKLPYADASTYFLCSQKSAAFVVCSFTSAL